MAQARHDLFDSREGERRVHLELDRNLPELPADLISVFLRHKDIVTVAKLEVPGRQRRMIGARVFYHVDAVQTEHVKETLGVADAGDRVHGRIRESMQ